MDSRITKALAYAFALASATSAAWYGIKSSDAGFDSYLAPAVMALLALGGVHALSIGAHGWRAGHRLGGIFVTLALLTGFGVTLWSGTGAIALRAVDSQAAQRQAKESHGDDRAQLARIQSQLTSLPASRPSGAVQADIDALAHHKRWRSTAGCTDATATASRKFCAERDRLRSELATSETRERLQARADVILARLRGAGAGAHKALDPQAEALAVLLSISPRTASAAYAVSIPLALEIMALALMFAAGWRETTSAPVTATSGAIITTSPPVARVDQFALACLDAGDDHEGLDMEAVWSLYLRHAAETNCHPLDRSQFETLFCGLCAAVGHQVRHEGSRVRALGLRVAT